MFSHLFRALATASMLASVSPARAEAPAIAVRDEAGLFSAEAVRDANDVIQEIQRVYHKHVIIETFVSASRFKTWVLKLKKPENRGRFYDDWARELARKAGPDSVVILMCREPAPVHVAVAAGRDATRHGFPADASQNLAEKLSGPIRQGAFDASLHDAVLFVRQTLDANRLKGTTADDAFPWTSILVSILTLFGVWLFLVSLRRIQHMNAGVTVADGLAGICNPTGQSFLADLFATMNSPWMRELARGWREDQSHAQQLVAPSVGPADHAVASLGHREEWADTAPPAPAFDASHTN